jgi:hypothetical protein
MTWRKIVTLATHSIVNYVRFLSSNSLHMRRDRLGKLYKVDQGDTYMIFRETISRKKMLDKPVVLIVGFRLRVIKSNPIFHWLFQRVCILTTPFWSGFTGFRVKLWMVDPHTKNYLGIYEWLGADNAQVYVNALVRVLRPLSTKGSVWYEIQADQKLELYLRKHNIKSPRRHSMSIASVLRYYYKSLPTKY